MLPAGMRTATLQVGPFLDDSGTARRGTLTVAATATRVWQPDGTVLAPYPVTVSLGADGAARLVLPATDQRGFTDADGATVTWRYVVSVSLDGCDPVTTETDLPAGPCPGRVVRVVVVPPPADPPSRHGSVPASGLAHAGPATAALARRRFLGALAVALPAAVLAPTAAAADGSGTRVLGQAPTRALAGPVPLANVIEDDVVIGSTARPRSLRIVSSGAGGTEPGAGYRDTTGRLHLESFQPHFGSYGETIRVHLKDARAKGMIAYLGDWPTPHHDVSDYTWLATQPRRPVTIAWIGAHFLDNDNPGDHQANLRHGHVNVEVPDASGALRTRLEIKLIDPVTGRIGTDKSAIRTHMADLEVQVGRGAEQLRIVGSGERDKDLSFDTQVGGTQPRWTLRAARGDSHLELRRYLSDGRYQDSPLQVDRYTGRITLGGATGTSAGVTVRQDGGVALTVLPLARGGQGVLVPGPAGDPTARALQTDVTGDVMRRFVVLVDGTLQWGDGRGNRDARLYRRAAGQLATDGSVFLRDVATPPRPTGGGVLFVSGGALRYRGSAGTVTTLAPA